MPVQNNTTRGKTGDCPQCGATGQPRFTDPRVNGVRCGPCGAAVWIPESSELDVAALNTWLRNQNAEAEREEFKRYCEAVDFNIYLEEQGERVDWERFEERWGGPVVWRRVDAPRNQPAPRRCGERPVRTRATSRRGWQNYA
jgi:hypothetical protein